MQRRPAMFQLIQTNSLRNNHPFYLFQVIVLNFVVILFPVVVRAQQFIPVEWQVDSAAYAENPWVRDSDRDRIDNLILDKLNMNVPIDIVIDLNRFVHRDTLIMNYSPFIHSNDLVYVDEYVSFLFVPDVAPSDVFNEIIFRKEVFLVEYAGGFKGDLEISVPSIGVRNGTHPHPTLHGDSRFAALSGKNVGIVIMDCGVNDSGHIGGHGAIPSPLTGWDFLTTPITSTNPEPYMGIMHGTIMAAIALGRGTLAGTHIGVAPGAELADVRAIGRIPGAEAEPSIEFDRIQAAFNKILEFPDFFKKRFVVNMSFSQFDHTSGSAMPIPGDGREAFCQLVNYAVAQGIVCIASAGNNASFGAGRISPPAAAFGAITVGASRTNDNQDRDVHSHASFTSIGSLDRGASKYPWKPDIVAPGAHIETPSAKYLEMPNATGTGWTSISFHGSSISTAHISGLAALMLEYKNKITPGCIKDALTRSAVLPAGYSPNSDALTELGLTWNEFIGNGLVDAYAAFNLLGSADVEIDTLYWVTTPVVIDVDNTIRAIIKNNSATNAALNIQVDLGISRAGIHPNAYSHIETQHVGRLEPSPNPSSERIVDFSYKPRRATDGTLTINARVEARYGGDTVYTNNARELGELWVGPVSSISRLEKNSKQMKNFSKFNFEIYNHLKKELNIFLTIEKPSDVEVKLNPSGPSLKLPPVTNPPLVISGEITYSNRDTVIITAYDFSQNVYGSLTIIVDPTLGVSENKIMPATFILNDNFPNPFSLNTQIRFVTPPNEKVTLEIYNILGQKVKTLYNKELVSGKHSIAWDGTDEIGRRVTSGIYFYRFSSNRFSKTKKMILMY